MANSHSNNLRTALREATRVEHDSLDGLVSQLDLRRAEDRETFSTLQVLGFRALARLCRTPAAEAVSVFDRMSGLDREASQHTTRDGDSHGEVLDPDAVAYVALGSQLGLTVMRRDLPPEARTGIFSAEPDIDGWKAFAARIGGLPSDTPAARRTISDARRAFSVFHAVAQDTLKPHSQMT